MADTGKILSLFATILLTLGLVFNIMPNLPRFPWDVDINKGPLKIYIPIFSALIISVILTVFFNYFKN